MNKRSQAVGGNQCIKKQIEYNTAGCCRGRHPGRRELLFLPEEPISWRLLVESWVYNSSQRCSNSKKAGKYMVCKCKQFDVAEASPMWEEGKMITISQDPA